MAFDSIEKHHLLILFGKYTVLLSTHKLPAHNRKTNMYGSSKIRVTTVWSTKQFPDICLIFYWPAQTIFTDQDLAWTNKACNRAMEINSLVEFLTLPLLTRNLIPKWKIPWLVADLINDFFSDLQKMMYFPDFPLHGNLEHTLLMPLNCGLLLPSLQAAINCSSVMPTSFRKLDNKDSTWDMI